MNEEETEGAICANPVPDIVARLRETFDSGASGLKILGEAADALERLRAENAILRTEYNEGPAVEIMDLRADNTRLRAELADWRQAAGVEANLKREFRGKLAAERERCAKLCDELAADAASWGRHEEQWASEKAAAAIRKGEP